MCVKEDNRFERQVPFALFQHVMFGALQVRIAQYQKFENGDSLFSSFVDTKIAFGEDFKVPKVILEYMDSIATCVTPSGDKIAVNQPRVAIPQGPIPEDEDFAAAPSGSFGHITAENHNDYECYASPFISRRLIERTIEANDNRDFNDWNPFPDGWLPEPILITKNLVGYHKPTQLHPEALSLLRRITFLNDDTLLGRIAYTSYGTNQVSLCLQRIQAVEVVPMDFKSKEPPSIFGYKAYDGHRIDEDFALFAASANVLSPYSLGAPMAFKCQYQGFKSQRNELNPGLSVVTPDFQPLEGWLDTINHNFEMAGEFAPRNMMIDKISMREAAHQATAPTGKIESEVSAHIYRTLKKR